MTLENEYCHCATYHKVRLKNPYYPLLGSLLIALLPKCPFCIMAYTSAITVCSTKSLAGHSAQWTSYISISLSLLTFCIVAQNYKGRRTIAACLLILIGSSFVIYSELYSGLLGSYYWGSTILIVGVWVNGSFTYFTKLFASRMGKPVAHHG